MHRLVQSRSQKRVQAVRDISWLKSLELKKMTEQPVFLNNDVVAPLLSYDDLIPRLEEVLGKFSRSDSSDVVQPVRSVIPIKNHSGYEHDPSHSESDHTSN